MAAEGFRFPQSSRGAVKHSLVQDGPRLMETSFLLLSISLKTSYGEAGDGFSAARSQEGSDRWLFAAVLRAIGMTVAGRMEKMKSGEEVWMEVSAAVLPRPCWLLAWALHVA